MRAPRTFGSAVLSVSAITIAAMMLQAANGLLQVLIPLRMNLGAQSTEAVGLVATGYGIGIALGSLLAPGLIRNVGHVRAYAAMAAVATITSISFSEAGPTVVWIILRFGSGIAMAGIFMVMDSWVSSGAASTYRGQVLSIYMIATKLALCLGPLVMALSLTDDVLFVLIASLMCASLLPVCLTGRWQPPKPRRTGALIFELLKIAPSAALGCFVVGLTNGPVLAMASLYGVASGMHEAEAASLVFFLQGGSLLFQWPLGWASDRWDRRYTLFGLGVATTIASGLIVELQGTQSIWTMLVFAAWGGTALCIYPVCIAHAVDRVDPAQAVPAVAGLLLWWAFGMVLGPMPAAMMMEWTGPGGLFSYTAVVSLAFTMFVVVRLRRDLAYRFSKGHSRKPNEEAAK